MRAIYEKKKTTHTVFIIALYNIVFDIEKTNKKKKMP